MSSSKAWQRALERTRHADGQTLPSLLPGLADRFGDAPLFFARAPGGPYSYRFLYARTIHYARRALELGFARGETIGLLMPNGPEYLAIWLALTRFGCSVALLNPSLPRPALQHCIAVAGARRIICDALAGDSEGVFPKAVVVDADGKFLADFSAGFSTDDHDEQSQRLNEPLALPMPNPDDRALLIYTSGTTGLPKAVNITHRRIVEWSCWFAGMMDVQPSDRLYNCLPMYHSVGGVVGVGSMLVSGGSLVTRRKFSKTMFWSDISETGCSIFLYIGELCRYLLETEAHPHKLRLACGNGLAKGVWERFQCKFHIPHILEFYAATEGNLSLYNVEGKPGAIGRIPAFLKAHFAVAVVRCDTRSGEPVRTAEGLCQRCEPGEVGEAVSLMRNRRFDGYTDPEATERKYLRDVFAHGDVWFRSGDLMRTDEAGFFYFVDRMGDTFRWKGENVSTGEVTAVVRSCCGVTDAVVYGVSVPDSDGKAGMAAIVVESGFDLQRLVDHCQDRLPGYAVPMFIRVCKTLDMTGTFKLTKADLVKQGYAESPDPVWRVGLNQVEPL